jgi:hypothetical protein
MQVGYRDLGGGDEVEGARVVGVGPACLEQVLLELGQLSGAPQRLGPHQKGWVDLGVAVLANV